MKLSKAAVAMFFLGCLTAFMPMRSRAESPRITQDFDADWRFSKGDFASGMMPAFDDGKWRQLSVPHDWSIEGPFSPEFGSGNGFAPGGIGWYRKHFHLDPALKGKQVAIEFDGVYDYSEVWVNGQLAGARPYGYESFQFDITPYLNWNSGDNIVAVRVDHSRYADSRYYTGSGIYRNVRLCITNPLRIAHWGVAVTTPKIDSDSALVHIETRLGNDPASGPTKAQLTVKSEVIAPDGKTVASLTSTIPAVYLNGLMARTDVKVERPQLWTLESPRLYTVRSSLIFSGTVVDETETTFGIRTATFDPNKGFSLNGVSTKLKGVCIHHDAGSLGAAVPDQVLERRLRLLKEIGVNSIRTSHNPPDPALLDMCDRLGFLVMDEAFDEFTPSKNKWVTGWNAGVPTHFGYGELFEQWWKADLSDFVQRDRNHPSVILWSIGNEIDYANDPFSDPALGKDYKPDHPPATDLFKHVFAMVPQLKVIDRTRPVTAALANLQMSNAVGLPQVLDAVGYNYQEARYAQDHKDYPNRIIYGSENSQRYGDWRAVADNDYIAGQFLWTGVDYLGEATAWPRRASGLGLVDLCGFKRPTGWFRQSLWSEKPMVYICVSNRVGDGNTGGNKRDFNGSENWNLQPGTTATVLCFTNCPEVTLSLNGKELGTKKSSEAVNGILRWQVPFESGTLEAVGHTEQTSCTFALHTAGAADHVELLPDTTQILANGKEVSQIEYRIVDSEGVLVPDADPEVKFDVAGPAKIIGIGDGDIANSENCQGNVHRAFHGRGLAIIQSNGAAGAITVAASTAGLKPARAELQSR